MKIAVIGAKSIPAKQGEIERYCQELYPRITERGHRVDLYVQSKYYYQPWFSTYRYRKIRVIALLSLPGKQLSYLFNTALNSICATFGNYDAIHFHGMAAAWFAWFPQFFSRSSIIVTCHQLDCLPDKWHKMVHWLLPHMEKTAVQCSDEIIVTSAGLRDYFFQRYAILTRYIVNAPASYVDCRDRLASRAFGLDKTKYLLYLGTFEPDNNLDLLIEAFQALQPSNWLLVLAGEIGNSLDYASQLLEIVHQQDNIIFTGEIRGSFLAELMRDASLFVDPSQNIDLGISMSLLEAMREGIPVVASNTLCHRKLLNSDRGLLFEAGDSNALLAQLKYAMCNPKSMQLKAKKAQTYVTISHNWDRVTYKNLFLYLQLTNSMPVSTPKI